MYREIFVKKKLTLIVLRAWKEVQRNRDILYTSIYNYARYTISQLYSCSLLIFLSIYQRTKYRTAVSTTKILAYESIKVISRILQADINRRRQIMRLSLVTCRRGKKRVHPHVQLCTISINDNCASRLKSKCDCELTCVRRRIYAHRAI